MLAQQLKVPKKMLAQQLKRNETGDSKALRIPCVVFLFRIVWKTNNTGNLKKIAAAYFQNQ